MTGTSDSVEFRFEYPWGRKSPSRRILDLSRKREVVLGKKRRLQDRFEERLVDFARHIEEIDLQIELAEKCENDRMRRRAKDIAHALYPYGVDRFSEIDRLDEVSEEFVTELSNQLLSVREKSDFLKNHNDDQEGEDDQVFVEDEDILSIEDLEQARPDLTGDVE